MTDRLQHPVISDAAAFLYIKFYLKGGKMRNITFAIYKGIEYSAGIKKDGRIVLRSEDDASKKEGFVEKEIGNNRIYVTIQNLDKFVLFYFV